MTRFSPPHTVSQSASSYNLLAPASDMTYISPFSDAALYLQENRTPCPCRDFALLPWGFWLRRHLWWQRNSCHACLPLKSRTKAALLSCLRGCGALFQACLYLQDCCQSSPPQGCLYRCAVKRLPVMSDALFDVVSLEQLLPHLPKDSHSHPFAGISRGTSSLNQTLLAASSTGIPS
jgi:hypothetical protein